MKFVRTKQLMFTNNKGGVGKTTTAFNIAKMFAKNGYKTVIIDLDPQCNISRLALGDEFMNNNLFSNDNIYSVLENIINGKGDINNDINFTSLSENLSMKQSKNGLVNLSWEKPIGEIQDYGQLSTLSQEKSKAIFEITEKEAGMIGTIDNLNKSKKEFQRIYIELLNRLN